jgi:hypothetical protein
MDADGPKPRSDIFARLGRLEPSATAREGFSALIIGGVISFGVKLFVTAATKAGELVLIPDLQYPSRHDGLG